MNTSAHSRLVDTLERGVVLDVTVEELQFRAYVVVSEPDLERVADFVPREQFEQDGDLHVAAVAEPSAAAEQVEDIAFNMNQGDAAVFLCGTQAAYETTLDALGLAPAAGTTDGSGRAPL
ncbi:hypothetical protein GSY71_03600 [Pusillimonas sp. TS35]|uniref:hypothetical protein n=1 Tax=Paracandidimonas lactea TaxID=2895524 RepID=UPI0013679E11|nr:hypothetical protein [Paracandidimonas lactea]MYN12237.1 hypothetical protein [Pusillimonas sp. TS35]